MGSEPPELLGQRPATEPLVSGVEGLDVGADLRDGGVPTGRVEGDGVGGPGRGVYPGEPGAGAFEPRVAWDRVLPGQPRERRPRRGSPGEDQQERARPRLLGGPRVHVIDPAAQDVCAQALHHQSQHDLGRRARDTGGQRAVRERGAIERTGTVDA